MMQQWFLDLDGVRSGPYQTPEVLSLIAEGEVLPHHRIAQGLKDQNWISILDWRLSQAHQKPAEVKEALHLQEQNPPVSLSPDYVEIPKDEPTPPPAIPPSVSTPISTPPPISTPILNGDASSAEAKVPTQKLDGGPPPLLKSAPPEKSTKSTRDPMAEMFDMLQNTKQKREAKSHLQAPHTLPSQSATERPQTGNQALFKTLAICLVVTIFGFVLGQIFQSSPPPATAPKAEIAKASPATGTATGTLAGSPAAGQSVPVDSNDRSTDKMIIRNKPEKAAPMIKVTTNGQTKTLDHKPTEKELEELKDLKKELQELKALKDELKSNPNGVDDSETDPSYQEGDSNIVQPVNPASGTLNPLNQNGAQ